MSSHRLPTDGISPADYELAVFEAIRLEFAPTPVQVRGTENKAKHTVLGRHSRVPRQLDAAAYRPGEARPFLIADAKRRGRKVHVVHADAFLGLMEDAGAELGLLVAPAGFTSGAARRVAPARGRVRILTVEDALTFRWLPVARTIYPQDWYFHAELAHAVRLLNEAAPHREIMEALETIAFDEWDAFMRRALADHLDLAVPLLEAIASYHHDDGWRFNAIELLDHRMSVELAARLLERERDPETSELLREYVARRSP
jgi:hypothetical protein